MPIKLSINVRILVQIKLITGSKALFTSLLIEMFIIQSKILNCTVEIIQVVQMKSVACGRMKNTVLSS